MVISILFAFSACSSKEYKETEATIPVTDENGKEVTDKNGEVVTEVITTAESTSDTTEKANEEEKTTQAKTEKPDKNKETTKKTTAKNDKKTTASSKEKTTASAEKTTEATTKKTSETESKKPEKRKVKVNVKLPYYNDQTVKLSVSFRAKGEKEYTKLHFPDPKNDKDKLDYEEVALDGKTTKNYEIGELTGDVYVKISISDVNARGTSGVIKSEEDTLVLEPYTGIEMLEGVDD